MNKKQRKKYLPLMKYEDKEHAKYFLFGAGLILIVWILSLII